MTLRWGVKSAVSALKQGDIEISYKLGVGFVSTKTLLIVFGFFPGTIAPWNPGPLTGLGGGLQTSQ
jgi:hypothetical protein